MKIIIVGAYGLVTDTLISRLNQAVCETFIITGSKTKEEKKHKGVIEEYYFTYDNSNIPYILESTKVDAVIFMGALDSKFLWNDQSDAVTFLSGLYNMILSASKAGVKRFIYLSTTELYQKAETGLVDENFEINAVDLKTKTIKNGENLVLHFDPESNMQVVVLRCSEVYGCYNDQINMQSFCTRIASELMKGNTVYIDKNKKHDYINASDVAEVVFNSMIQKQLPHNIYNICSGNSMTESLTVRVVSMLLETTEEVKLLGDSPSISSEYSCELAKEELGFSVQHSSEDGFIKFVNQLKSYEASRLVKKKKNIFARVRKNLQSIWGWFFPYFETVAVFAVIELIILLAGDYSYLKSIDFYLLYVVFISIIYGKGQTITALLLCLAGKVNILGQDLPLENIVIDFNIYLWLLHLLIIGMGVGYVRDSYKQTVGDKEEEINYLNAELTEIKEINHSNIQIKKIYENRLVNYQDSFARIYSIISKLSDLEPDKIMFEAVEVVSQIMKSNEIVIYQVDKKGAYARLAASSMDLKNTVKKSIQLSSLEDVYEDILKKKIYVNRVMDYSKPSMAGGVFHEDILETIVMIRSLPFESTTLYHMNLFSVVLNLVAQALHRANFHIEENKDVRYYENTHILTPKAFNTIMNIKKMGHDTSLAEYCMLEVVRSDNSLKQINDKVIPILRQQDNLGVGENDKLYLLLANTSDSEADIVINRLSKNGITTRKEVFKADAS